MRKGKQGEAAPREGGDFLAGGSRELQDGSEGHAAEIFGSGKSLLWVFMSFEEEETQQIPSGMQSDCCHSIQSAMKIVESQISLVWKGPLRVA